MGKKIICECGSIFPLEKVKNLSECPICGASFDDFNNGGDSTHENTPSFGEGIELGENDSFDEDKIDFYYNGIINPGELGEGEDGLTGGTCVKCGYHTSFLYPIAQIDKYVFLDSRETGKCCNCGNILKNHILKKLPSDWVDPRKQDMLVKDYENVPRCPICNSTSIYKISMTNKAASALAFGVLAAGHVSKTWKCDVCGSKF